MTVQDISNGPYCTMWGNILPAYFVYIFLAVTLIDTAVMIILLNTVCKK